jgi:predicted transcriptional regulator
MSINDKKPPIEHRKARRPRTLRDPENVIIEMLCTKHDSSWSELFKHTELGKATLSKHINNLITKNVVTTKIDPKKPRTILYTLTDPLTNNKDPHKGETRNINSTCIYMGQLISEIEDRKVAREVFRDYLKYVAESLISNFVDHIFLELIIAPDEHSIGGYPIVKKIEAGERIEDLSNDISQLWKEYSKKIDANSTLEALFWSLFKNSDFTFQLEGSLIEEIAFENGNSTNPIDTRLIKTILRHKRRK